jgi:hypothetical protein
MSCISVTDSVAAGEEGSVLTSARPAGGFRAWPVFRRSIAASGLNAALSCVKAAPILCATTNSGNVVTSTDPGGGARAWQTTKVALLSVDCPTASLCVGGGNGDIAYSTSPTGGTAARPTAKVDGTNAITTISCPTRSFCAGVDMAGNVITSTDPAGGAKAWQVTHVDTKGQPFAVDCPSASLCVIGDLNGYVLTSSNPTGGASAWHAFSVAGADISTGDLLPGRPPVRGLGRGRRHHHLDQPRGREARLAPGPGERDDRHRRGVVPVTPAVRGG